MNLKLLTDEQLREELAVRQARLRAFTDPEYAVRSASYQEVLTEQRARHHEINVTNVPHLDSQCQGAVVWIAFSEYELANIAEMYKAILPYRTYLNDGKDYKTYKHIPHPFDVFHSGDWTGQTYDAFITAAKQYTRSGGNLSAEEYRTQALTRTQE